MKDYKSLLKKFWAGDATGTEKLQLYKLVAELEAGAAPDTVLNNIEAGSEMLAPEESQRILHALRREMDAGGTHSIPASRTRVWPLLRVAAAAAVVFAIVWGSRELFFKASTVPSGSSHLSFVKTITNNQSSLMTVRLEDGSQVSIYPAGSISYPDTFFTGSERVIHLTGKANFKVQHNAARPFQVIASQIKTTDIGTEFCIDAEQPDIVKIKLKEGVVRVQNMQNSLLAIDRQLQHPGEEVCINLATRKVTTSVAVAASATDAKLLPSNVAAAPVKAKLSFRKAPLPEVFAVLSKRHQVKIIFDKAAVEGLTFTGELEPQDPLEVSLDILCSLNGLAYTKKENYIEITRSK